MNFNQRHLGLKFYMYGSGLYSRSFLVSVIVMVSGGIRDTGSALLQANKKQQIFNRSPQPTRSALSLRTILYYSLILILSRINCWNCSLSFSLVVSSQRKASRTNWKRYSRSYIPTKQLIFHSLMPAVLIVVKKDCSDIMVFIRARLLSVAYPSLYQ